MNNYNSNKVVPKVRAGAYGGAVAIIAQIVTLLLIKYGTDQELASLFGELTLAVLPSVLTLAVAFISSYLVTDPVKEAVDSSEELQRAILAQSKRLR